MTNPYAAPRTAPVKSSASPADLRVEGAYLVVTTGARLPHRCFYCNAACSAGDPRTKRTLYYATAWLYLLLFVNILVLALAYLIARQPVRIEYSFCPRHTRQQRLEGAACMLALVFGIYSLFSGQSDHNTLLSGLGMVLLGGFFILLIRINRRVIRVHRHERGRFWLRGLSPDFLARINADRARGL